MGICVINWMWVLKPWNVELDFKWSAMNLQGFLTMTSLIYVIPGRPKTDDGLFEIFIRGTDKYSIQSAKQEKWMSRWDKCNPISCQRAPIHQQSKMWIDVTLFAVCLLWNKLVCKHHLIYWCITRVAVRLRTDPVVVPEAVLMMISEGKRGNQFVTWLLICSAIHALSIK